VTFGAWVAALFTAALVAGVASEGKPGDDTKLVRAIVAGALAFGGCVVAAKSM